MAAIALPALSALVASSTSFSAPPTSSVTSCTVDSTYPMPTATPAPGKPATQTASFVFSAILFGIAIISLLKAAAFFAHLFLVVIRSRVKGIRGDVIDVVKDFEANHGGNGDISCRVLALCDKFMVQRIATFGTLGVSSFPWYTCNVHGVMMQVWRNYCELNVELQKAEGLSLSPSSNDPSVMIADQFNSYPDQWKTVITCARQKFRAYLAGQDAFPDTQSGLDEVERYLVDALPTHLEGGAVEPKHNIDEAMIRLVYAERWLFPLAIRTQLEAIETVFPAQSTESAQRAEQISNAIKLLACDGSYLHDTVPDSVYFAHPIIVSVVGSFYNGEWSDVLAHGQPGWKDSAPEQLIVLIGTIYKNALNEWSNGHHKDVALERKIYEPTYDGILDAISTVNRHTLEGVRLRERLVTWAKAGANPDTGTHPAPIPTTILLKLAPEAPPEPIPNSSSQFSPQHF